MHPVGGRSGIQARARLGNGEGNHAAYGNGPGPAPASVWTRMRLTTTVTRDCPSLASSSSVVSLPLFFKVWPSRGGRKLQVPSGRRTALAGPDSEASGPEAFHNFCSHWQAYGLQLCAAWARQTRSSGSTRRASYGSPGCFPCRPAARAATAAGREPWCPPPAGRTGSESRLQNRDKICRWIVTP